MKNIKLFESFDKTLNEAASSVDGNWKVFRDCLLLKKAQFNELRPKMEKEASKEEVDYAIELAKTSRYEMDFDEDDLDESFINLTKVVNKAKYPNVFTFYDKKRKTYFVISSSDAQLPNKFDPESFN